MSTEALYAADSSLKIFQSEVTAVNEQDNCIALAASAFYPGGGGQPADQGALDWGTGPQAVTRLQKDREGNIWHYLGVPLPAIGQKVNGQIDWTRRYQLMRTHTAMHILCGVVYRDYGALVTGGDMEPLKGRMDFEFESLQKEFVQVIEAAVNREIKAARDVRIALHTREEAFQIPDLIRTKINLLPEGIMVIRTVEIVGLDLQADGGTHVQNTLEVGHMRIVDYKSKGKINKRIYVEISDEE
ncbi:MAG TPA: alanyl-tRNA editing protein [Anaerolineaceae bacterium]|nr:alanyl-tRNA editing protein [Anaerolineaceae bacterium]HPN50309.1 alanyl-tRNA editing protein [Anaerolineaceae bacterium]